MQPQDLLLKTIDIHRTKLALVLNESNVREMRYIPPDVTLRVLIREDTPIAQASSKAMLTCYYTFPDGEYNCIRSGKCIVYAPWNVVLALYLEYDKTLPKTNFKWSSYGR